MTASVVTFSSQMGSGGAVIARRVAEKLRYRYYDWEIISQAAAEAGVSPEVVAFAAAERFPSLIERIMTSLGGQAETEEQQPPTPGQRPSIFTSDDYRQIIEHVVRELADKGDAVISGHAGQAVLKAKPGILKVLIRGSPGVRAQRLAQTQSLSAEQALSTISQSDKQRLDFFKRAYHLDWLDAAAYDVSLSTDRLSPDLATDMIVAMAREVP